MMAGLESEPHDSPPLPSNALHSESNSPDDSTPIDSRISVLGLFEILYKRLQNGEECNPPPDVTFLVGSKRKSFLAHRFQMAVNSPTLGKMVYGRMKEANEETVILELSGLECAHEEDGETFEIFLTFCYTGRICLTGKNAVRVVELCDFLQADVLKETCMKYMGSNVTAHTVCPFLESAAKYGHGNPDFFNKCGDFLKTNISKVLKIKSFCHLSKKGLSELLAFDDLKVNETELFKGLVMWGKARVDEESKTAAEDLMEVIGDLLPHIRFPIMSPEELTEVVLPENVVPHEMLVEAFAYQAKYDPQYYFREEKRFCPRMDDEWHEQTERLLRDSVLLNPKHKKAIENFICGPAAMWELVYKGSRDGFESTVFHKNCDNVGPTVTLIKVKDKRTVFGGFTRISWSGSGFFDDPAATLFSLEREDANEEQPVPRRFFKTENKSAIYCHPDYGPTFGGGYDICVANNGNASNASYCRPSSYGVLSGQYNSETFSGSYNWTVGEIEVFCVRV